MPTSDPPADRPTVEQEELVDALLRVSFTAMGVLSKLAAENDLSLTQLRVLGILRDRRLTMSALADHLGLDRSSVSGLVERTEKRGLLERAPNPRDGRSVEVGLSAAGREAARRGTDQVTRSLAPLASGLSRSEGQRLTSLLERLLDDGALGGTISPDP